MSQPPLPQSRRKLLKSIALGSGAIALGKTLPDSWTKPVIESVVLPVHAQASAGAEFTGTYSDTVILALQSGGPGPSDTVTAQVYIVANGDGSYDAYAAVNWDGNDHTTGEGTNLTIGADEDLTDQCGFRADEWPITINVGSPVGSSVPVTLTYAENTGGSGTFQGTANLSSGGSLPADPVCD